MKDYWLNAVSYETYLKDSDQRTEEITAENAPENQAYLDYYTLGKTRMARVEKTYRPDEEQLATLATKNFDGKILIISEGWCGDAAMIIPVIRKFFEGKNEIRITYRDQNDLIEQFLTNGAKSIPIVIFLDQEDQVISHWGPRPKHGMELLKRFKENPQEYDGDQFHNDLQIYYTKNKGKDIIDEILEKL